MNHRPHALQEASRTDGSQAFSLFPQAVCVALQSGWVLSPVLQKLRYSDSPRKPKVRRSCREEVAAAHSQVVNRVVIGRISRCPRAPRLRGVSSTSVSNMSRSSLHIWANSWLALGCDRQLVLISSMVCFGSAIASKSPDTENRESGASCASRGQCEQGWST